MAGQWRPLPLHSAQPRKSEQGESPGALSPPLGLQGTRAVCGAGAAVRLAALDSPPSNS